MNKYQPLETYLRKNGHETIPMNFSQIENIIKDNLPASARKHRAWWSNNPSNSVITYAWLAAGYKTSGVRLGDEKLTFRKRRDVMHSPPRGSEGGSYRPSGGSGRHPVFGALKGTIIILPGVDLTDPADPDWGSVSDV